MKVPTTISLEIEIATEAKVRFRRGELSREINEFLRTRLGLKSETTKEKDELENIEKNILIEEAKLAKLKAEKNQKLKQIEKEEKSQIVMYE